MREPLKRNTQIPAEFLHDILADQPALLFPFGFSNNRSRPYVLYIACIFLVLAFILYQAALALALLATDIETVVNIIHSFLAGLFTFFNLMARVVCNKGILKGRQMAMSGFYKYQGEELDDESLRILGSCRTRIRSYLWTHNVVGTLGCVASLIIFTVGQLLMPASRKCGADSCNPYLPILPFPTPGYVGLCLGLLMNYINVIYTYATGVSCLQVYASNCAHLAVQMTFLRHSITHVFERADRMYLKTYSSSLTYEERTKRPEFQACLYRCLRSNVEHQQVIKRFQDAFKNFNGAILLSYVFVSAFILGSRLYILMKVDSFGKFIPNTLIFFAEQTYGLFCCNYGQMIVDESTKLFESMYSIPWYLGNKSFNKALRIFMLQCLRPMKVKTVFFNLDASIEAYGNIMSAVYKASNVFRQSDSLQR